MLNRGLLRFLVGNAVVTELEVRGVAGDHRVENAADDENRREDVVRVHEADPLKEQRQTEGEDAGRGRTETAEDAEGEALVLLAEPVRDLAHADRERRDTAAREAAEEQDHRVETGHVLREARGEEDRKTDQANRGAKHEEVERLPTAVHVNRRAERNTKERARKRRDGNEKTHFRRGKTHDIRQGLSGRPEKGNRHRAKEEAKGCCEKGPVGRPDQLKVFFAHI